MYKETIHQQKQKITIEYFSRSPDTFNRRHADPHHFSDHKSCHHTTSQPLTSQKKPADRAISDAG